MSSTIQETSIYHPLQFKLSTLVHILLVETAPAELFDECRLTAAQLTPGHVYLVTHNGYGNCCFATNIT